MVTIVIIICAVAVFFGVYTYILSRHITVTNDLIDKNGIIADADTWWEWFRAKLIGWKTYVIGLFAMVTQSFSFFLTTDLSPFKDLPWTLVFEEKIANWITFACAALMPITAALSRRQAAEIPPTE